MIIIIDQKYKIFKLNVYKTLSAEIPALNSKN